MARYSKMRGHSAKPGAARPDFPVHRCLKLAPLCYPIPEEEMPLSEDEKARRATLAATAAEEGREEDVPEAEYVDDTAESLAGEAPASDDEENPEA